VTSSLNPGFLARSTDGGFIASRTSGPNFPETTSTPYNPSYNYTSHSNHGPTMRPLFVKTAEGGSVEITNSAQNTMSLPSPFKHF
jgi:hypothetical protein